jgi:ferritin-like metal-binding protein YciE
MKQLGLHAGLPCTDGAAPLRSRNQAGAFRDLFLHTLRDIYYAEKQIIKSLPEMVEKATDAGLKRGFQEHLKQTENHVKRLEQVFDKLGKEPKGVDCPAIDGIIDEAEEVAGEVDQKIRDGRSVTAGLQRPRDARCKRHR